MRRNALERSGEFVIVRPAMSSLDVGTAATLKKTLVSAAETRDPILLVDLSAVVEIDSSGIGALVAGLKAARGSGGTVRLFGVRREVRDVMTLTMLDRVLPVFDTVEEAMEQGAPERAEAGTGPRAGRSGAAE